MAAATLDECVQITVDEQSIAGTFVTPAVTVPGVLFIHGWGGSQQKYLARAREIAALGCVGLTFNLRGHVETEPLFKTVSRQSNLADVLAAYDRLAARADVDPDAIAVVGSSYGGYLGAILSAMRPVKWLALRAPALYVDSAWTLPKLQLRQHQDLATYRRSRVAAADNKALAACQTFRGDVMLIESAHDDLVPQTVLASYREACSQARSLTYRCMADADHGLTHEADQLNYTRLLVAWLKEMLFGARRDADARDAPAAEPVPSAPESPPKRVLAEPDAKRAG